jgi:hypothetical protein
MCEDRGVFTQMIQLISFENSSIAKTFNEKFLKAVEVVNNAQVEVYVPLLISLSSVEMASALQTLVST